LVEYAACVEVLGEVDYATLNADPTVCAAILSGASGNNPLQYSAGAAEQFYLLGMDLLFSRSRLRIRALSLEHLRSLGRLPSTEEIIELLPSRLDRVNPKTKRPWAEEDLSGILIDLAAELERRG
jgi:hypothetical protein